jgi:hypothetical protein
MVAREIMLWVWAVVDKNPSDTCSALSVSVNLPYTLEVAS